MILNIDTLGLWVVPQWAQARHLGTLFHDSFDVFNEILLFVNGICHWLVKLNRKLDIKTNLAEFGEIFKNITLVFSLLFCPAN